MLKAVAAAVAIAILGGQPALANTLLTGAIRDRAGVPVGGARVAAFDARGRKVGEDVAIADGTFALDARTAPATLAISCDYCEPVRLRLVGGEPVVVIVERFTAVTTHGPSAPDIRALPYRDGADIASLQPFTVVQAGRISDRALDRESALTIDGLPFYNAGDGSTPTGLVPAHAVAALRVASPLVAPVYGGYAAAGVYDLRLRDPDLETSRFDLGDAADVVARVQTDTVGAGYAASSDTGEDRQAASADANVPLAGGRLSFDAVDLADSSSHASGAGLAYVTDSRRYTTSAALTATQTNASSFAALSAALRNHGPLALEFGTRAYRATSAVTGPEGAQFDAAIYAGLTRDSGFGRLQATIAWDHGSDSSAAGGTQAGAVVGSLGQDLRLGPRWSAQTGVVSNLRIPALEELAQAAPLVPAGDRTLLFEQALTYADLRRVRVTAMAYSERTTGSEFGRVNGVGADFAWQIAPRLSLRAWLLRANQSAIPAAYAFTPYQADAGSASAPTRQLIWLTYEKEIRVDALVRGGALEGDLRIPLGAAYAVALGSARYYGRRVTTFGLTFR